MNIGLFSENGEADSKIDGETIYTIKKYNIKVFKPQTKGRNTPRRSQ